MKDLEMAENAHRYAINRALHCYIEELGNFLRMNAADPGILLKICDQLARGKRGVLTFVGIRIPFELNVRYGRDPMSEQEYQELLKKEKE